MTYLRSLVFISIFFIAGFSVDHQSLPTYHLLEVDENSVRIELINFHNMTVFSTGERRNNEGELTKISIWMTGLHESEKVDYLVSQFDITNRREAGNNTYVPISVNGQINLYDGNRTDASGVRPRKPPVWINARRNARIEIIIESRELDCAGTNNCNRGNTGKVVYALTIPEVPDSLPSTCEDSNTFRGIVLDNAYSFNTTIDFERGASGGPIIEPWVRSNASLCIKSVILD